MLNDSPITFSKCSKPHRGVLHALNYFLCGPVALLLISVHHSAIPLGGNSDASSCNPNHEKTFAQTCFAYIWTIRVRWFAISELCAYAYKGQTTLCGTTLFALNNPPWGSSIVAKASQKNLHLFSAAAFQNNCEFMIRVWYMELCLVCQSCRIFTTDTPTPNDRIRQLRLQVDILGLNLVGN